MSDDQLRSILTEVAAGSRSIETALDDLRDLPYEDVDVALLDHHRSFRTGVPEVVYGLHKTPAQIATDCGTHGGARWTRLCDAGAR